MVPGIRVDAHFVLHLDHDDRVGLAVYLATPHQSRESRERPRHGCIVSGVSLSVPEPSRSWRRGKRWKSFLTHRVRSWTGFSTSEPQSTSRRCLLAGILNQAVNQGVVECLRTVQTSPRKSRSARVFRCAPPAWARSAHVFEIGGRVVAQLSAKARKGLHRHQLRNISAFSDEE